MCIYIYIYNGVVLSLCVCRWPSKVRHEILMSAHIWLRQMHYECSGIAVRVFGTFT